MNIKKEAKLSFTFNLQALIIATLYLTILKVKRDRYFSPLHSTKVIACFLVILSCSILVETLKSLLASNVQGKYNFSETIILLMGIRALTVKHAGLPHVVVILHDVFLYTNLSTKMDNFVLLY